MNKALQQLKNQLSGDLFFDNTIEQQLNLSEIPETKYEMFETGLRLEYSGQPRTMYGIFGTTITCSMVVEAMQRGTRTR